jgi:hypothetical protein
MRNGIKVGGCEYSEVKISRGAYIATATTNYKL